MAFIVEQYVADRGIQLGSENMIRAMPWGANWNKLRIGCRVAANGYSSIPLGNLNFPNTPILGYSEGAKGHLSQDCVDTIFTSPIALQTANYIGTSPAAYYYVNSSTINFGTYQKVGSTSTQRGWTVQQVTFSAVPSAIRSLWYIEIEKNVLPDRLNITYYVPSPAQALINSTRGDFLKGLENEGTPSNTTIGTVVSTSLSPATRAYDHVFIGWSRAIPTMCFFDFSVVRFY